jgi:hypothetical protein
MTDSSETHTTGAITQAIEEIERHSQARIAWRVWSLSFRRRNNSEYIGKTKPHLLKSNGDWWITKRSGMWALGGPSFVATCVIAKRLWIEKR